MTAFDPSRAETWDEQHHALYDIGHRDGESCRDAAWWHALEDLIPDEVDGLDHAALVAWVREQIDRQENQ